ncbi:MAG TPA: hypothetical protein VF763_08975 [Candidatus Limnocylindrales bacterium]
MQTMTLGPVDVAWDPATRRWRVDVHPDFGRMEDYQLHIDDEAVLLSDYNEDGEREERVLFDVEDAPLRR